MSVILDILHADRRRERVAWEVMSAGAALAGALVARTIVKAGWRKANHADPPQNPLQEDVDWNDALWFGLVTGAIAGVVRILFRRAAATGWNRFRDEWPPMR